MEKPKPFDSEKAMTLLRETFGLLGITTQIYSPSFLQKEKTSDSHHTGPEES